jgi:nucleoside-diphosphate-sugar epimerase
MNIAILGATSQIAKDFIINVSSSGEALLSLYSRKPDTVKKWIQSLELNSKKFIENQTYDLFGVNTKYDAIINFVGVGDPYVAQSMGASILDITSEFDQMALNYLKKWPKTRYIFLSSGAAYGSTFTQPATEMTPVVFNINNLKLQDWYGVAKFYAECMHRSLNELSIIDIRVFSYFSATQNINSGFLISDILRAISNNFELLTNSELIIRDYLHPIDFYQLIMNLLLTSPTNSVVDCYSKSPIEKIDLLEKMQKEFGLKYKISPKNSIKNATGLKPHYYSLNRRAADYGYIPKLTSLEGIFMEARKILNK